MARLRLGFPARSTSPALQVMSKTGEDRSRVGASSLAKEAVAMRQRPADKDMVIPEAPSGRWARRPLPRGGADASRQGRRLLDGPPCGHECGFPSLRRSHWPRDARRAAGRCRRLSGCEAGNARALVGDVPEGVCSRSGTRQRHGGLQVSNMVPIMSARRREHAGSWSIRRARCKFEDVAPAAAWAGATCRAKPRSSRHAAVLEGAAYAWGDEYMPVVRRWPTPGRALAVTLLQEYRVDRAIMVHFQQTVMASTT